MIAFPEKVSFEMIGSNFMIHLLNLIPSGANLKGIYGSAFWHVKDGFPICVCVTKKHHPAVISWNAIFHSGKQRPFP